MPHGICLVKMVFDQSKNHLTIVLTNQNDWSKILVEITSQKCQPKLSKKVHGLVTMDMFKTICPKWLRDFLMLVQNGVLKPKFIVKKIRNFSIVSICDIFIYNTQNTLNELLFMRHKLPWISFVHICIFAPCIVMVVLPCTTSKIKQGVHHTVALPFTLKLILRQKKNYGNSNISPWKNIILKKSSKRNQNPSRYYNSIIHFKFQHQPKYHLSKIFI